MTDALPIQPAAVQPEIGRVVEGALWGLGAAAIWAGWWVVTRLGVTSELAGTDLAALRFGVAGLLMLPVLLGRGGRVLAASPWLVAVMALGAGAPYALVAGAGLRLASAGNGGALTLGLLPMFTALLAALCLGERIGRARALGLGIIVAGALAIAGHGLAAEGAWAGHLVFALGALMWAGFSVAMRRSGLDAMTAAAAVCVVSAAWYVPVYLAFGAPETLLRAPAGLVLGQAVYQGVLSAFGALYCYGRAIRALGPTRAALFATLVPVLATAMGAALLGERPAPAEMAGVALLSTGAALAACGRGVSVIGSYRARSGPVGPRHARA